MEIRNKQDVTGMTATPRRTLIGITITGRDSRTYTIGAGQAMAVRQLLTIADLADRRLQVIPAFVDFEG
jgi:hypothetical protein